MHLLHGCWLKTNYIRPHEPRTSCCYRGRHGCLLRRAPKRSTAAKCPALSCVASGNITVISSSVDLGSQSQQELATTARLASPRCLFSSAACLPALGLTISPGPFHLFEQTEWHEVMFPGIPLEAVAPNSDLAALIRCAACTQQHTSFSWPGPEASSRLTT